MGRAGSTSTTSAPRSSPWFSTRSTVPRHEQTQASSEAAAARRWWLASLGQLSPRAPPHGMWRVQPHMSVRLGGAVVPTASANLEFEMWAAVLAIALLTTLVIGPLRWRVSALASSVSAARKGYLDPNRFGDEIKSLAIDIIVGMIFAPLWLGALAVELWLAYLGLCECLPGIKDALNYVSAELYPYIQYVWAFFIAQPLHVQAALFTFASFLAILAILQIFERAKTAYGALVLLACGFILAVYYPTFLQGLTEGGVTDPRLILWITVTLGFGVKGVADIRTGLQRRQQTEKTTSANRVPESTATVVRVGDQPTVVITENLSEVKAARMAPACPAINSVFDFDDDEIETKIFDEFHLRKNCSHSSAAATRPSPRQVFGGIGPTR